MKKTSSIHSKYSGLSERELLEIIETLTIRNNRLTTMLFGSRSERFASDPEGQRLLFNEVEELIEIEEEEKVAAEEVEKSDSDKTKKRRGKRVPLPEYLPRTEKITDLPEEEKKCSLHNVELVKIGEERVEKLEIEPAKASVTVYVTLKYKCPCGDCGICEAARPADPIPKSFASPGLLAYIATQKYVDGLPLSRQERIFERADISLSRTTMARWIIKASELSLPLISLMHTDLLDSPVVHADETTVQVLNEPNKTAESTSYMWCLARSGPKPIIYYSYHDNRSRKAAADLLVDFKGTVIADAYKVYDSIQNVLGFKLAGCWAHARRRFWEAEKFGKKASAKTDLLLASKALSFIRKLYAVEDDVRGQDAAVVLEARQRRSTLILEEFRAWLLDKELIVLPKSPTGKAISYALSQWDKLTVFSQDGLVAMDNNYLEAHIKPFAVGRKNWLFASVQAGAHASANLYSLVESAKVNGVEPFDYLNLIFKELPSAKDLDSLDKLLPYNAAQHYQLRHYSSSKK